jgi:hypothetical protein
VTTFFLLVVFNTAGPQNFFLWFSKTENEKKKNVQTESVIQFCRIFHFQVDIFPGGIFLKIPVSDNQKRKFIVIPKTKKERKKPINSFNIRRKEKNCISDSFSIGHMFCIMKK